MQYDWQKVKTALEKNDTVAISQIESELLPLMEKDALKFVMQGMTYFEVAFNTMMNQELKLLNDKNNKFVRFLQTLIEAFCKRHSITVYREFKRIRPGDKIFEKWKHKGKYYCNPYDVIDVNNKGFTLFLTYHQFMQGWGRENAINHKDFVFGLSRDVRHLKIFLVFPTHQFNDEFEYFDNMEPNITSFEVAIKSYLDKRAEEDQVFAQTYAKPNKSIKECCKYICGIVEKQRKNNEKCVACSDEEVFGLAVHYYDEDEIVVEAPKTQIKAISSTEGEELIKSGEAELVTETESSEPKRKTRKPRKPKAEVDPNIPEPLDIPIF